MPDNDIRYLLSPDLKPEHDALDRQVWDEIEKAMSAAGRVLDERARTENSLSFRRQVLLFERAERVVRLERARAPEWKPAR